MKMLLVGFQPKGKMSYPHLQQVAEYLFAGDTDYALFRERGYFLGDPIVRERWVRSLLSVAYTFATICIDTLRLVFMRVAHDYEVVIAVDNFSYLVASRLFPDVVLWSHDFVTDDQPRSRSMIQRFIKRQVASALLKHRRLIIQDQDRLQLFRATHQADPGAGNSEAFLLPVSLLPLAVQPASRRNTPPVLMQIGGISASRSRSDELLEHFQSHHDIYALAFHGYFEPTMAKKVTEVAVMPWISSVTMAPGDVHKVVEKCDMGFIAYNSPDQNFFHVARASGQLAEFLRCGKPVITLGRSSLGPLLEAEHAGIAISDIGQLGEAVQRIDDQRNLYSSNCKRLFAATYDLTSHLPALSEWLSRRRPR